MKNVVQEIPPIADCRSTYVVKMARAGDEDAVQACLDRLEEIALYKNVVYIVRTNKGTWGKGESLRAAGLAALKAGGLKSEKAYANLIVGDESPYVDKYGALVYAAKAGSYAIGLVGTLGGVVLE